MFAQGEYNECTKANLNRMALPDLLNFYKKIEAVKGSIPRKYLDATINEVFNRLREDLAKRYMSNFDGKESYYRDGLREEAQGYGRFISTIDLAFQREANADAIIRTYDALLSFVDRPGSGSTAWQMRRYLRRAPVEMLGEFGDLVKQLADVSKDQVYLDFDFFYFDFDNAASDEDRRKLCEYEIDRMKYSIDIVKKEKK